jgi:hypothetical protein
MQRSGKAMADHCTPQSQNNILLAKYNHRKVQLDIENVHATWMKNKWMV